MSGWWVTNILSSPIGPSFVSTPSGAALLFAWVFWVVASIVLHELGHGWMALRCGDDTPRALGHMTLNPLVHMGGFSLIAFALIGIAWGAMPVNPHAFRGRYDDAKVAFAGPAVNVLLVIGCVLFGGLWVAFGSAAGDPLYPNLATFFWTGAMLNVVLLLFNLIPVMPLDGSRILMSFVPSVRQFYEGQGGQFLMLILFFAMFQFAGKILWPAGRIVAEVGIGAISGLF